MYNPWNPVFTGMCDNSAPIPIYDIRKSLSKAGTIHHPRRRGGEKNHFIFPRIRLQTTYTHEMELSYWESSYPSGLHNLTLHDPTSSRSLTHSGSSRIGHCLCFPVRHTCSGAYGCQMSSTRRNNQMITLIEEVKTYIDVTGVVVVCSQSIRSVTNYHTAMIVWKHRDKKTKNLIHIWMTWLQQIIQ